MKRGRKPEPASTKVARGTYRRDRDADKLQLIVPDSPPMMPEYLDAAAEIVWQEEIGRVMEAGAGEMDSSEFAAYCSLEASCRKSFLEGDCPPITALAEARKKRELFGLAGPKSRILRGEAKKKNPFAKI
ncbi:MAG: hypothetical protein JKY45_12120 [Emcibacter sp.]|nr:hypothetical protein [Emcibacter sp.]